MTQEPDSTRRPGVRALREALPTLSSGERSVAELAVELEDSERAKIAAHRLVASAKMAPELFPDAALTVMAEYFDNPAVGSLLLKAVRLIFAAGSALDMEDAAYAQARRAVG